VTWKEKDEASDAQIARLTGHLKDVLREESTRRRRGEIPNEPPMPSFQAKSLKQLGTPTADSLELAKRALCSPEQLAAAIERERERRRTAGFADDVQATQPPQAPKLDGGLVGAQLEICWCALARSRIARLDPPACTCPSHGCARPTLRHYTSTEDNKTKVPIWCPCKVVRVADGVADKGSNNKELSANARAIAPRGMTLVEWEADPDRGEQVATTVWYLLDPRKWNADHTHRAWRFHPAELAKRACAAREQREAPQSPEGCRCGAP
jgi:hypothetical protein